VTRDDTRSKILAVTCEILDRVGENGLRLADVAKKANIREASIYHHFASRKALLEDAQIERFRSGYFVTVALVNDVVAFSDTREQWESGLRKILQRTFSEDGKRRRSIRASALGYAQSSVRVRSALAVSYREIVSRMAEAVGEAQRRGWVNKDLDPNVVAPLVLGIVEGRRLIETDDTFPNCEAWNLLAADTVIHLLRPQH